MYLWQWRATCMNITSTIPNLPGGLGIRLQRISSYVESVKDRYEKILITDKYDQPIFYFCFTLSIRREFRAITS